MRLRPVHGLSGYDTAQAKPYMQRTPLDQATIEAVDGHMGWTEFEAVVQNYLDGHPACPACGRFPVSGYGLCERHDV